MNARRQRIVVVVALAVIAGMSLLAIAHFGPIRPSDRAADNRGIIGPTRPQSPAPAPVCQLPENGCPFEVTWPLSRNTAAPKLPQMRWRNSIVAAEMAVPPVG